jgi:hypothetical protein
MWFTRFARIAFVLAICVVVLLVFLHLYSKQVDVHFNALPKSSLDDFVAKAKTGDIVFFWPNNAKSGLYHNYIASSLQAWATETPYTHVAVVYRKTGTSGTPGTSCENLHLITADRYPAYDLVTDNTKKTGNQMVSALDYIKGYNGRIAWWAVGKLLNPKSSESAYQDFLDRIDHRYYMNIFAFANLGFQTWDNKTVPEKTICTTTVFDFLKKSGVIGPENIYSDMNRMNIGIRELIGAMKHSGFYDDFPETEISPIK